jgi:hypothetical protein
VFNVHRDHGASSDGAAYIENKKESLYEITSNEISSSNALTNSLNISQEELTLIKNTFARDTMNPRHAFTTNQQIACKVHPDK